MAKSRRSKYVFILGDPVLKRSVYLGVAALFIFVASILGGGYYLMVQNRASAPRSLDASALESETVSESVAVEGMVKVEAPVTLPEVDVPLREADDVADEPQVSTFAGSPLVRLIEKHLKATKLGELDAFIVNGTAGSDSVTLELSLFGRRPNLYKLKTESDQTEFMSQFG